MPKNLDATIRYRVINSCLINKYKKFPSKESLISAIETRTGITISVRTLDKDIFDMRFNESLGYNAPIEFDKKQKGYYYSDPNYSIDSIPIGQSDLNAIEFAAEVLGQYKNVNILNDFKGAVSKIIDTVKVQRLLYNEPKLTGSVQLDKMDNSPGNEHLNNLIESIKSRYIVEIWYQKFDSSQEKKYVFEPYILKEFDGLWYITGKLSDSDEIRTFALDRIQKVDLTGIFFKMDKNFNKDIYYNFVYGVTHTGQEPQRITIKTDNQVSRFLNVRPLHPTQKIIQKNDTSTTFEYQLTLNPEIESKLMSFGFGCEVLEPEVLRQNIKQKFKQAVQNYE